VTTRFCTLFNIRYASRGLAMLESLVRVRRGADDDILVLALDGETAQLLRDLSLGRWRVIQLPELGDAELMKVKETRPFREFCWTTTPALCFALVRDSAPGDRVVYLDADMLFFRDPQLLLDELEPDGAILIHEHRYSPDCMIWLPRSGRFNVGLVGFQVGPEAEACVTLWREQVIAQCEVDLAKGHCGDQGYLDEWPALYPHLRIMRHIGGGVAPWNIAQYRLDDGPAGPRIDGSDVIFYHYHSLSQIATPGVGLVAVMPAASHYPLTDDMRRLLYRPYVRALLDADRRMRRRGITLESELPLDQKFETAPIGAFWPAKGLLQMASGMRALTEERLRPMAARAVRRVIGRPLRSSAKAGRPES